MNRRFFVKWFGKATSIVTVAPTMIVDMASQPPKPIHHIGDWNNYCSKTAFKMYDPEWDEILGFSEEQKLVARERFKSDMSAFKARVIKRLKGARP